MAKMTKSGLTNAMTTYVAAAKQAGTWTASTNNMLGALDKIGKTITIDGLYNDKLSMLEGDELPAGKTIEEYFIDLTLPEAFGNNLTTEGAKDIVPAVPSVEAVAYSYTLGRQKIKTTVPFDNLERAFNTVEGGANALADISVKLQNSYDLTRFAEKKQLLANAIAKCATLGTAEVLKQVTPITDTSSANAFIKQIKTDVGEASYPHEGGLGGALIGAAPKLYLFVKKGILPILDVDSYAGAINPEKLGLGPNVEVIEVDDFGNSASKYIAFMCDARGVKLHNGYNATRQAPNADGDFVNIVRHFEDTGFISKYCYMKAYKDAA